MKKNPFVFSTMTRKETGKEALTAILGGVVCSMAGYSNWIYITVSVIGSVLSLVGFVLAIIWLYRLIAKKP